MLSALRLALWLFALATATPALAADDPPGRVGRISLIEGSVAFRGDRDDAGGPASLNWPVSGGAIVDTGHNGRAEIQVGSNVFRLGADSRAEFVTVDEQRISLQLGPGSLAVSVRDDDQAEGIEIATPAGQVRFDGAGRYRIDVSRDKGQIEVSSREGQARIIRSGGELGVGEGRRAVAYAGGGWFVGDLRNDAFDAWSDSRDHGGRPSTTRRYVSPQMTGYEDLDRYGNWGYAPEYGQVWYPSAVPLGWAPYRSGRWAWVPPWGWTWVDEAPWGFAPFHYGRWAFIAGQWAWVPGPYTAAPVYAPALVAWIGNPGWSLSFGFGAAPAVGWFPLAPYEVFVPAYHHSPHYVQRLNAPHEHHHEGPREPGHPHFAYRDLPQAVTVVPARVVQSGSLVSSAPLLTPDHRVLRQAPVAVRAPDREWLPPAVAARHPRPDHGMVERPRGDAQAEWSKPGGATPRFEMKPALPFQPVRPENRTAIELPPPVKMQPTPPAAPIAPAALPETRTRDLIRERHREEHLRAPAEMAPAVPAPPTPEARPEHRPAWQMPPGIPVRPTPESRPERPPETRWRPPQADGMREGHAPAAHPELPPPVRWSPPQERRPVTPQFERPPMAPPMPQAAPQPMQPPPILPAPRPFQPASPGRESGHQEHDGRKGQPGPGH